MNFSGIRKIERQRKEKEESMSKLNQNIFKIQDENEFFTASRLVKEYREKNPEKELLSLRNRRCF